MIGLQGRKITSAALFHDNPVNIFSATSAFFRCDIHSVPSFPVYPSAAVRIPQKNSIFNQNKL